MNLFLNLSRSRTMHVVALATSLSGCLAPVTRRAFGAQFPDNQASAVRGLVERLPTPVAPSLNNTTGRPLAVVSTHGEDRALVALDLTTSEELWRQPFDAATRPEIFGDLIVVSDREAVYGFSVADGRRLWRVDLPELAYVGAARDGDRVFYAASVGVMGGRRREGVVVALDATSGRQLWRHTIEGTIGQPAATAGVVFVPWDLQNLSALDGLTGDETARLRSTDDVIRWVRADSTGVYYGHHNVYRFDPESYHGIRTESTTLAIPMQDLPRDPPVFEDGFLPKPGIRSAQGRIRLYFRPGVDGEPIGSRFYFVYYRHVFAFDAQGALVWARVVDQDVIQAEPLAGGLLTIGEAGRLALLSTEDGHPSWVGGADLALASAGIDAAGFSPTAAGSAAPLAAEPAASSTTLRQMLSQIVLDPDNRLIAVRSYAAAALARLPDPEITRDLLELYVQRAMPRALRETIETSLQQRSAGTEFLITALEQRFDYLENTEAPPLHLIVPALLNARAVRAVPALMRHLFDHETRTEVLGEVARAVSELGDESIGARLMSFLQLYRADSSLRDAPDTLNWIARGVFRIGGAGGRQLLTSLAEQPLTHSYLRETIRGLFAAEAAEAEAAARAEADAAQRALADARRQEDQALPVRLTQRQVTEVFSAHAEEIRACVAPLLETQPMLGQIRVGFLLNGAGRATDIGLVPNTEEFVACLRPRIEAFEFPRFRARVQQASFVISLRGDRPRVSSGGRSPFESIDSSAPWWQWTATVAQVDEVNTPLSTEVWWARRSAPRTAQVIEQRPPQGPTQPEGGARPWWVESGDDEGAETPTEPSAPPTQPVQPARPPAPAQPVAPPAQEAPAQPEVPAQPAQPSRPTAPAGPPAPPAPQQPAWWGQVEE